ncbi:hypothetical protein H8S95_07975 [Pontibacter sp. KCTC 32443]|uniref:hypothetical protein n=1 Tax=Pontibacter TaxID=323449 RepID=UPI00164E9898|nr:MULTISPECIES: hypothetical protein [Pontibacter]MBC5773998.1 hypothetical protein [Pontibacter sp. KCTC 32443]
MHRYKPYLIYYRSLMSFALPFSLLSGIVSLAFSANKLIGFINAFSVSILTGSFLLALFFYEQRYQNQYYFYHNLGISKVGLIVGSCLLNITIVVLLFILKLYLYA